MKYLIQVILGLAIAYLIYLLFLMFKKEKGIKSKADDDQPAEEIKRDPICGTYIPISQTLKYEEENQILHFCSRQCLEKYQLKKKSSGKE